MTRQIKEVIEGFGHENVQGTHHTTIEFTKEARLSRKGDCVLVVSANKGLNDLSPELKKTLKKLNAKVTIKIEAGGVSEEIQARGSPNLTLTHPEEMVLRKSDFVSDRTLGINANKAAKDLSREFVGRLKNPLQKVKITIIVWA